MKGYSIVQLLNLFKMKKKVFNYLFVFVFLSSIMTQAQKHYLTHAPPEGGGGTTEVHCDAGGPGSSSCSVATTTSAASVTIAVTVSVSCSTGYYACCIGGSFGGAKCIKA